MDYGKVKLIKLKIKEGFSEVYGRPYSSAYVNLVDVEFDNVALYFPIQPVYASGVNREVLKKLKEVGVISQEYEAGIEAFCSDNKIHLAYTSESDCAFHDVKDLGENPYAEEESSLGLTLNFLGYSVEYPNNGQTGIVIELSEYNLVSKATGIADAIRDAMHSTTSDDVWPEGFKPSEMLGDKYLYEQEYLAILDQCVAALNYQKLTNPEGNFSDAYFWVEVVFDSPDDDDSE